MIKKRSSYRQSVAWSLCASLVLVVCASNVMGQDTANQEGWIQLFNGKNLDGWTPKITHYKFGENYANTFRVEDGMIKVRYDQYDGPFNGRYGHLFFKEPFSHYRIRVEYRFVDEQAEGGAGWALRNSGIMFHCQPPETMMLDQEFPVSIEAQLLGGNGKDERPTNNLCTPGTNVVMDGKLITQHCTNSHSKTYHGEQWVTAEVEVHGDGIVKHFVNGEQVMEYEKPQLDDKDSLGKALIKDGNLLLKEGYISLQSESHPCDFRKVEILMLKE